MPQIPASDIVDLQTALDALVGGGWISGTPTGAIDGVNAAFGLPSVPATDSEQVEHNGLRLRKPAEYTISGTTITTATAPIVTDEMWVRYWHSA